MIKWLYKWLPIICGCHCLDERSFHIKGVKFPVCARCTGILLGMIAGFALYAFFKTSVKACFLLLLPLMIDGFAQRLTDYESNNFKRVISGFLFGYALTTLFVISTAYIGCLGYNYGKSLRK